jgi:predicted membrane protein
LNWKAILVCFLVVIIMAPTIIFAIMESPWFLLLLFALLLIFPFVLAPSQDKQTGERRDAGPLATILLIVSLVFGGFVLAVGLLVAPEFFLLMLLVCAPLLWLAFRSEP